MLAVLASGCGRVAFDASPDAPPGTRDGSGGDGQLLGHDEDGDGIPDPTDLCPHIADVTNADSDGDLVGDVCDPQPQSATQQWLFFTPMMGATPFDAAPASDWTYNTDDWQYAISSSATIGHVEMILNVDIWVGLTFEALGGTGRQAAIIIHSGAAPYWYGEIFDSGTNVHAAITEYTGSLYVARSTMNFGASFPLGDATMHYSARSGGPLTLIAETQSGTGTATYNAAYVGGVNLFINFGNHAGRVRYVAVVTSQ